MVAELPPEAELPARLEEAELFEPVDAELFDRFDDEERFEEEAFDFFWEEELFDVETFAGS